MRKQPALFLDRDGVINEDSYDYVKSWDEFRFRADALAALKRLHEHGVEVYVISNQSGVGRGYFSKRTLLDTFTRMRLCVAEAGGLIHGIHYCPHRPDEGCHCRKPRPGQLLTAAAKYGIDLQSSVFVGDSCSDVNAAHAADCSSIFLTTRRLLPPREGWLSPDDQVADHLSRCEQPPDYVAESLSQAVDIILSLPQFAQQ